MTAISKVSKLPSFLASVNNTWLFVSQLARQEIERGPTQPSSRKILSSGHVTTSIDLIAQSSGVLGNTILSHELTFNKCEHSKHVLCMHLTGMCTYLPTYLHVPTYVLLPHTQHVLAHVCRVKDKKRMSALKWQWLMMMSADSAAPHLRQEHSSYPLTLKYEHGAIRMDGRKYAK